MKVKAHVYLSEDARAIREAVFMKEQGFQNEFDSVDEIATHLVLYDGEAAVATCRVFWEETLHAYVLGRLAVRKEYRGKALGSLMVEEAVRYVKIKGGKELLLHAQCRVVDFYQKLGFHAFGEMEDDEGCPHIWMKKTVG